MEKDTTYVKKKQKGTEEMTLWLKSLSLKCEDTDSVTSTHVKPGHSVYNFSMEGMKTNTSQETFWPPRLAKVGIQVS